MASEKTAEQLAREWLSERLYEATKTVGLNGDGMFPPMTDPLPSLAALLESYGARVRKEALEEAAALVEPVSCEGPGEECARMIRALIK